MNQIKIENFGPIKSGYEENNGFLDIRKVTVFIGDQATGKSSIAKLISTFTWLEKALYRGNIEKKDIERQGEFEGKYCNYHRLKSYFQPNTKIEFIGATYSFSYDNSRLSIHTHHTDKRYQVPKIMYVPAERNFLSTVDQPEKLRGLPSPLYTFLGEFDRSLQELTESVELPVGYLKLLYQDKIASILGKDYEIRLLDASSGLQSAVPLFLVSQNLTESITKESDSSRKGISLEEEKRLRDEVRSILNNKSLSDDARKAALEEQSARFKNACFINIVEEIEQNLFPESQKKILYKLLEFANNTSGNSLILTTHSPYIVNYLTLAIKGASLLPQIHSSDNASELLKKLDQTVSVAACVAETNVAVYQLEQGRIETLPIYKSGLSDENYLNNFLENTNTLFDESQTADGTIQK